MEGLEFERQENVSEAETADVRSLEQPAADRGRMLLYLKVTLGAGLALALVYLGLRAMGSRSKVAAAGVPKTTAQPVQARKPVAAVAPQQMPATNAAPKPAPVAAIPAKAEVQPAPPAKVDEPVASREYDGPVVDPHSGDIYLQTGAFGPRYLNVAIKNLEKLQFTPLVAHGPDAHTYRVLIGPLKDNAAAEQEGVKLTHSGVEWIVRRY